MQKKNIYIKTIKLKIVKYFINKETYRWMEILPDLTYSYNQSYHRSIKMSPSDAQDVDSFILWKRQYAIDLNKPSSSTKNYKNKTKKNSSTKLYTKRYKFKLGDKVKISYIKKNSIESILKDGLERFLLLLRENESECANV